MEPTYKKFLSIRREGTAVKKNFFTTAADGKNCTVKFYNLDASISTGYRVYCRVTIEFRTWPARNVGRRYCRSAGSQ